MQSKHGSSIDFSALQGVSYTVSTLTLPTLLHLPSSSSAAHALTSLQSALRLPVFALSSLAAAPLFLSFVFSPRYARHPYLFYTSLLAVLSLVAPDYLPQPATPTSKLTGARRATSSRARMEASYEVLGDSHSEGDLPSESELEDINGEEVRANVEGTARAYLVRTGFAAAAFVLSVVGLWGDGAPRTVRYY
jgi:autophagy-related protein 33